MNQELELHAAVMKSSRASGCPVCGGLSFRERDKDGVFCPKHGEISGMQVQALLQLEPIDALIELRAEQALEEIHAMARMAAWWASPLKADELEDIYHEPIRLSLGPVFSAQVVIRSHQLPSDTRTPPSVFEEPMEARFAPPGS